jgi:hypothetical protein
MGIRQSINKHPFIGSIAIVAIVAIGAVIGWSSVTGPRLNNKFLGFYSDDDGKTFFADTFPKLVPFDHNGHQAYRARVFRCGTGQASVAWLEAFPDDVNASFNSQTDPQARFVCFQSVSDRVLVKRPGDPLWVASSSETAAQPATGPAGRGAHEYQDITTPPCFGTTAEVLPGSE